VCKSTRAERPVYNWRSARFFQLLVARFARSSHLGTLRSVCKSTRAERLLCNWRSARFFQLLVACFARSSHLGTLRSVCKRKFAKNTREFAQVGVQEHACGALHNLALNHQKTVAELGAVLPILEGMQKHVFSAAVRGCALAARRPPRCSQKKKAPEAPPPPRGFKDAFCNSPGTTQVSRQATIAFYFGCRKTKKALRSFFPLSSLGLSALLRTCTKGC